MCVSSRCPNSQNTDTSPITCQSVSSMSQIVITRLGSYVALMLHAIWMWHGILTDKYDPLKNFIFSFFFLLLLFLFFLSSPFFMTRAPWVAGHKERRRKKKEKREKKRRRKEEKKGKGNFFKWVLFTRQDYIMSHPCGMSRILEGP